MVLINTLPGCGISPGDGYYCFILGDGPPGRPDGSPLSVQRILIRQLPLRPVG